MGDAGAGVRPGMAILAGVAVLGVAVGATLGLRDGGRTTTQTAAKAPQSSATATASEVVAPAVPVAIPTPKGPLVWTKCADIEKLECASVQVPLDYTKPEGEQITIALSRLVHTATDYRGVILVNPGGPGSPGREIASAGAGVARNIGTKYDWIGFDPRGIGKSQPALSCDPAYVADKLAGYVPTTPALTQAWLDKTKAYAASCAASPSANLLPHVRSIDTVRDMESIRLALGAQKISYWGNSYGSLLGQGYATLFPDRVDKMLLDGVVDANKGWYESNLDQNVAMTKSFGVFITWLADNPATFKLGSDPAAITTKFYQQVAALQAKPVASAKVSAVDLTNAGISASYGVSSWNLIGPTVAAVLTKGDANAYTALAGLATETSDNARAGYLAVQCSETTWPSWSTMKTDADRMYPDNPLMTWQNTWMNAPCAFWPVKPQPRFAVDGSKLTAPLLLTSETLDAATPYAGAVATRERFPTARLASGTGGTTHSSSMGAGPCLSGVIADFLDTGALPARAPGAGPDKECPPVAPTKP